MKHWKSADKLKQVYQSYDSIESSVNIKNLLQSYDNNVLKYVRAMDMFTSEKTNSNSIDIDRWHQNLSKWKSDKNIVSSPLKLSNKSHKYSNLKESAAIAAKESKQKKINDECTFNPVISEKLDRSNIRSAKQFYKDQKNLELKKAVKIYMLKKTASKKTGINHKPKLSRASEELAMKRNLNDPNIHNRLHMESNLKKVKSEVQLLKNNKNKLIRRKSNEDKINNKIEDYLYNDAIVRRKSR